VEQASVAWRPVGEVLRAVLAALEAEQARKARCREAPAPQGA
jgi:hypothetical protein